MTFSFTILKGIQFNIRNEILKYTRRHCSTKKLSTIFSLSSGQGKCGAAVIRVSGPQSKKAFQRIFKENETIQPRFAYLRKLKHPTTNEVIDRGLCLWFPGPKSFTGEDCCEFQVHGGPAIIVALLDALNSMKGLSAAKPGEFTKRAFYAGKLDLTEVEGLADLIHAETEQQRKQALIQADGSLSKLYERWRHRLIRCLAHVEAYIDFAEDQNIEDDTLTTVEMELEQLQNEITIHLNDGRRGEMLRHGVRTVIVGAPNVGKSSFMNKICRKPISIVTDIAGTTRDVIEGSFNICGYPVVLADTAGFRKDATDIVEVEGISRTLLVLIGVDEYKVKYLKSIGLNEADMKDKNVIFVVNKIDLVNGFDQRKDADQRTVFVSCKDDIGISDAVSSIAQHLKDLCGEPNANSPNLSQQRHRHLLEECLDHINELKCTLSTKDSDLAIAAQYLLLAIRCIGQISGHVNTEEILDVIFSEFCIGK